MSPPIRSALLDRVPHGFSLKDGLAPGTLVAGGRDVTLRQVHSARVITAEEALDQPVEADGLVTARAGLVLHIVTADCAPILLADIRAGIIGAVHAGWRGAQGGIIGNAVAAMEDLGANRADIRAAIGPTIARDSYEVDAGFRAHFGAADEAFFSAGRAGHWQFDLPAFCRDRLARAGVGMIDDLAQDTYAQPRRFHSFRRATHRGEPTAGRQTSAIGLPLA